MVTAPDRIERAEIIPIRVSDKTIWRHIALTCGNDQTGFGEYTLNDPSGELDTLMIGAARYLTGKGLEDIDSVPTLPDLPRDLRGHTVLSALDQALCDLRAKARDVSLARYLNPEAPLEPVPLYANINRRTTDRSAEGFAESAAMAMEAGYRIIKIAPFDGVSPENCEIATGENLIDAGLDRIRAVAEVLSGKAELRIDCHWRFTAARATDLIRQVAKRGGTWLECPIPEFAETVPDLQRIRVLCGDAGMRLAGCETMNGIDGFEPFITARAYDVIMPDVKHAGGHAEVLRIADLAAEHGIAVSLHNPSGPIAHAHSVHVSAALNGSEALEVQFDESPLYFQVTTPAPMIRDGAARLPEAPGLGLVLS